MGNFEPRDELAGYIANLNNYLRNSKSPEEAQQKTEAYSAIFLELFIRNNPEDAEKAEQEFMLFSEYLGGLLGKIAASPASPLEAAKKFASDLARDKRTFPGSHEYLEEEIKTSFAELRDTLENLVAEAELNIEATSTALESQLKFLEDNQEWLGNQPIKLAGLKDRISNLSNKVDGMLSSDSENSNLLSIALKCQKILRLLETVSKESVERQARKVVKELQEEVFPIKNAVR